MFTIYYISSSEITLRFAHYLAAMNNLETTIELSKHDIEILSEDQY